MFDIGWAELLLIAVIAIVVVGPKDLPRLMATLGRYVGRARRMAAEFQKGFEDMAREAELEDLRREIDKHHGGDLLKNPPPIRPDDDDVKLPSSNNSIGGTPPAAPSAESDGHGGTEGESEGGTPDETPKQSAGGGAS